jgi:hypothetical protein
MVWASCVSSKTTVRSAVEDAVSSIMQQQPDFQPDLALVFASCNYGSQLQDVVRAIRREVPSVRHVFGCSVSSLGMAGLPAAAAAAAALRPPPGYLCIVKSTKTLHVAGRCWHWYVSGCMRCIIHAQG